MVWLIFLAFWLILWPFRVCVCIGSGFVSQDLYLHGFFSASIKLPADYTAGVVVAFYVSFLFLFSHSIKDTLKLFYFILYFATPKYVKIMFKVRLSKNFKQTQNFYLGFLSLKLVLLETSSTRARWSLWKSFSGSQRIWLNQPIYAIVYETMKAQMGFYLICFCFHFKVINNRPSSNFWIKPIKHRRNIYY